MREPGPSHQTIHLAKAASDGANEHEAVWYEGGSSVAAKTRGVVLRISAPDHSWSMGSITTHVHAGVAIEVSVIEVVIIQVSTTRTLIGGWRRGAPILKFHNANAYEVL
jgi:hypothetical protein